MTIDQIYIAFSISRDNYIQVNNKEPDISFVNLYTFSIMSDNKDVDSLLFMGMKVFKSGTLDDTGFVGVVLREEDLKIKHVREVNYHGLKEYGITDKYFFSNLKIPAFTKINNV